MPVEIETDEPMTIASIRVDVEARAWTTIQNQYGRRDWTWKLFHQATAHLHDGGELPPGRISLPCRAILPAGVPTEYAGEWVRVEYVAVVVIDIPWKPAIIRPSALHVLAVTPPAQAKPVVAYSRDERAAGGGAVFELSLPTTELTPGAELEVAASFADVDENRYRALDLELVAVETDKGHRLRPTQERVAGSWTHEIRDPREGEPLHIRVTLPADLVPAFDLETIGLRWMLRARARVGWSRDPVVEIPVTVHPGAAPALVGRAPEVGAGRIAELWGQVGAASGLRVVEGGLSGEVAGSRITIRRERDGRGSRAVADLELSSLHVGLRVLRKGGPVRTRDERQQELLAHRLAAVMREASVVSADDERVRCAIRSRGDRRGPFAAFVARVIALARAIAEARSELPPPARLDGAIDRWQAAAGPLGAHFEAAGPSLTGTRDGARYAIGVIWGDGGEPVAIEVRVSAPAAIDERQHLRWDQPSPPPDSQTIAPLCAEPRSLEIDRTGVRAEYAREGGVDRAAAQLPALAALVNELCRGPGGGAYR